MRSSSSGGWWKSEKLRICRLGDELFHPAFQVVRTPVSESRHLPPSIARAMVDLLKADLSPPSHLVRVRPDPDTPLALRIINDCREPQRETVRVPCWLLRQSAGTRKWTIVCCCLIDRDQLDPTATSNTAPASCRQCAPVTLLRRGEHSQRAAELKRARLAILQGWCRETGCPPTFCLNSFHVRH